MNRSVDVSTRVSGALSTVIEAVLNAVEDEEAVTLAMVRFSVERGLVSAMTDSGRLPVGTEYALATELATLIEEYGEDTLALDFESVEASEPLSRVIQAELDGYDEPGVPTLGSVHESMLRGLTARLIGEGAVDPDDEQTLLAEIEALVARFGEDAPAEHYLRYE
jgi:hypothetical protein